VELYEVIRRRRMVRAFDPRPVPAAVLDRILLAGLRAPSAGNTQGWELLLLEGPEQTGRYWDVCLPPPRRGAVPWPGLLHAPVLVIPLADPAAYLRRYAEPDKARSRLGESADRWPVPYWLVDTSFLAMSILLAAVDEGLGALFFGLFEREGAVMREFGVPAGLHPIGTIAIGFPAPHGPSRSLQRGRRPLDEVVHRGGW
jgi:nitroreductase